MHVLVILFVAVFVSLLIFIGNLFTIFVFWKHRTKLKRTFFLLINLAVADLCVGFTAPIVVGTYAIPRQIRGSNSSSDAGNISTALHPTFSLASVFFLVLISLERAYALIWPLRHRASSTKIYIYSVIFVWIAVLSVGVAAVVAAYGHLETSQLWVAVCFLVLLALITIFISYLAIWRKLTNREVRAMDKVHNMQNTSEQNTKLSRTRFIVIAVSIGYWFPGILVYPIHSLCSNCLPGTLIHVCGALHLVNSLVNPIIHCFRIPIFRETLKRMKIRKHSKRYTVNYSLWNKLVIETRSFSLLFRDKLYVQYTNMRTIRESCERPYFIFWNFAESCMYHLFWTRQRMKSPEDITWSTLGNLHMFQC